MLDDLGLGNFLFGGSANKPERSERLMGDDAFSGTISNGNAFRPSLVTSQRPNDVVSQVMHRAQDAEGPNSAVPRMATSPHPHDIAISPDKGHEVVAEAKTMLSTLVSTWRTT